MSAYGGIVIGGPCAGEHRFEPRPHLVVAVWPPLPSYDLTASEMQVEIPAQRFEYRYTQLGDHALWVPHDWTMAQVMAELLSHYSLQAGVRARRG
jgi:hypothetical protein